MKVEEAVDKINSKPSWRFFVIGILFNASIQATLMLIVGNSLSGFMPYNGLWKCQPNSTRCFEQTKNGTVYNRDTFCGEDLQLYTDYVWDLKNRTTFAVEFNMTCGNEYIYNLCNTLFFVGGFFTLLIGGQIMDVHGRKPVILVFGFITVIAIIAGALPSNLSNSTVLMVSRTIVGGSVMVMYVGVSVFNMELSPVKYRPIACIYISLPWVMGYLLYVACGYLIKTWEVLSLVPIAPLLIGLLTTAFVPESPRFLLVSKKDVDATKRALAWFARLNRSPVNVDQMDLEVECDDKDGPKVTMMDNLKTLVTYKEMGMQLGIMCYQWITSALLYYGFTFSWSKLSDDLYIAYLFAALGDFLAQSLQLIPMFLLPRKTTIVACFASGAACLFLALIPFEIKSKVVSFKQLLSLLGAICISVGWNTIFLQGNEAAPTTHRAIFNTWVSSAGRLGSIIGTQANLLFNWSRSGTLAIFGGLAAVNALLTLRMPETRDLLSPELPSDVKRRYSKL